MDNFIKPINLEIAEKLRKDEVYRRAFFRAFTADDIALQIRKLRNFRGFKQVELAVAANMKQSAVSRIEQAEYSSWTFNTLLRIAEALNARLLVRFQITEDAIKDYEPGANSFATDVSHVSIAKTPEQYRPTPANQSTGTYVKKTRSQLVGDTSTAMIRSDVNFMTVHGMENHG